MYILEFGRGPDRKKRKRRQQALSNARAFGTSIVKDTATGITASIADAALAYALIRRGGLSKNRAVELAKRRFTRNLPLTIGVSTLTGTYGGVSKIIENKRNQNP